MQDPNDTGTPEGEGSPSEVGQSSVADLWGSEVYELAQFIPGGLEELAPEDLEKVDIRDSDKFPRTVAGYRMWQRARDALVTDLNKRGYGSSVDRAQTLNTQAKRISRLPYAERMKVRQSFMDQVRRQVSPGTLTR